MLTHMIGVASAGEGGLSVLASARKTCAGQAASADAATASVGIAHAAAGAA